MKIVVTGSLGYVGTPLAKQLVEQGHDVTVISSKAERKADIEALGAKAAIGVMQDADFLTGQFTGADAVYCMLAPAGNLFDASLTVNVIKENADKVIGNYVQAIQNSGVKRVVYLSTVGAHMNKDNGLLIMHHNAENTLNQLPDDVAISFMRPVGFYKNLFGNIQSIKTRGVIASVYGEDDIALLVAAEDIAAAIVDELTAENPASRKVRYIASEELTCNQAAHILGSAIGKPDLKWVIISEEQLLNGMKAAGMSESIAESFVVMNANIHNGKVYEDYYRHKPVLGKMKLTEFAKQFAAVYQQQ
jgi:uncharacterized protein YbjT (DUF2867 family)